MSNLGNLLDQIREYYLTRFAAELNELEKEPGARLIVEPALLTASGNIATDGPLGLAIRQDLVVLKHERITSSITCDTETMLVFDALRLRWNDALDVTIAPFQWNYARLTVRPALAISALAPLKHWFETWFKEPDSPREPPFWGVVHFMSDPKTTESGTELTIDLGSAPTESIADLLDACQATGAKSVSLGKT